MRALGIYRETEFSPGKVEADAAILDAVLAEAAAEGAAIVALDPETFASAPRADFDLVFAMCQGERALARLAALEEAAQVVINPALAIRNCYRDLLSAGLKRAGVPIPRGALVETTAPLSGQLLPVPDLAAGVFVKRGDLHALSADDVVRADGVEELREALFSFAARGIKFAYVEQAVAGAVVKFYGVSGGEYFTALAEDREPGEATLIALARAAATAADALGLEAWGGDAVVNDGLKIIDFNDWPSFSRVREQAARAIVRRALRLLKRSRGEVVQRRET